MTATAEITTTKVAVGDYEFHLNQAGDPKNPAVVFLHGSGPGATGLSNWERVLADLGDDYFCLAPDVIGFGDSTHPDPPPQGIVPFTQLRVDTILGLLDALGIAKASFVGNSMGGMWSLGIVRQAPQRVEDIVLMGSGGAPPPPGRAIPRLSGYFPAPWRARRSNLLRGFVSDPARFGKELDRIPALRLPR